MVFGFRTPRPKAKDLSPKTNDHSRALRTRPTSQRRKTGQPHLEGVRVRRRIPRAQEGVQGNEPRRRGWRGASRWAARPRRRGLPHGAEVVVPAQGSSRPDIPLCQRRRKRAGHDRQSRADGERSAPDRRGHHLERLRRQGDDSLLLYPLRISAFAAANAVGDRRSLRRRVPRQEYPRLALFARPLYPSRRRRLCLRRRDGPDREPRRQAGMAADQTAVSGRRRALPQADRREQRRDAGLRHAHHRPRRRLVPFDRRAAQSGRSARRRQPRPEAFWRQRTCQSPRLLRGRR